MAIFWLERLHGGSPIQAGDLAGHGVLLRTAAAPNEFGAGLFFRKAGIGFEVHFAFSFNPTVQGHPSRNIAILRAATAIARTLETKSKTESQTE